MLMRYPKEKIKKELLDDRGMFYRKGCLKHSGVFKDDVNLTYQEYISKWLIDRFDKKELNMILTKGKKMNEVKDFSKLTNIKNRPIFYRDKKDGKDNHCHENYIAIRIVEECREQGKKFDDNIFINWQIPINRKETSIHGKLDLLGFNDKEMLLVELKDNDNKDDTLLRAIIEIYTYYLKIVSNLETGNNKLSPDYFEYIKEYKIKIKNIVPCVMFFRGYENKPMQDFDEMKEKKNNLYNLSKKLGIRFFSVRDMTNEGATQLKPDYKNTNYEVKEEKY